MGLYFSKRLLFLNYLKNSWCIYATLIKVKNALFMPWHSSGFKSVGGGVGGGAIGDVLCHG
jgi:hypothetical protein